MTEAELQVEWGRSLKGFASSFYNKIADPDRYSAEHTQKRPFDCFYIINGKIFCFELKQIREPTSFYFEKLEEHQFFFLCQASANGGNCFVISNWRFEANEKQQKKYGCNKKENFVIAINIDYYDIIKNIFMIQGKKSIPLDFILGIRKNGFIGCHVIEWMPKNKMWDVGGLLGLD